MAISSKLLSSYLALILALILVLSANENLVVCGSKSLSCDIENAYDPCYDNSNPKCQPKYPPDSLPVYKQDIDLLQFPQNIEHWEADFFLWGAFGYGLDVAAPELVYGGPPPIGVRKANLDELVEKTIREFALEEVGHLRVLKRTFGGIPRPLMDMSVETFSWFVNEAFGYEVNPPFDPYRDSLGYMMASYIVPYLGLTGYVGGNSMINGYVSKRVLAGLLGVEAGQDAVIRMYLYERRHETMHPYNFTVAEFTAQVSKLRNRLGMCGVKDEGVVVPRELGAERNSTTNILASNQDDISYQRTPAEILRIVYGTGSEHVPGGFYPKGANGRIARDYLNVTYT
ncbi:hypothetical protein V2J09_007869 [Rumex salicifolius]